MLNGEKVGQPHDGQEKTASVPFKEASVTPEQAAKGGKEERKEGDGKKRYKQGLNYKEPEKTKLHSRRSSWRGRGEILWKEKKMIRREQRKQKK